MLQNNRYIINAKIKSKVSDLNFVKEELIKLTEQSIKEEGVVDFSIFQTKTEPDIFIMWEVFKDELAFKKHFEYEHTKNYINQDLTEVVEFFNIISI